MLNSLRGLIEDPDFTQPVTLYRGGATDTDQDGYEEFRFGPPEAMEVLIASPDAVPYVIEPRGPEDDTEFVMCVMAGRNITQGDRVVYDAGFGPEPFEPVEPQFTDFDGDEFVWFRLIPDNRGQEAPGDDSPDDGSGVDDTPDDGSGTDGGGSGDDSGDGYGTY